MLRPLFALLLTAGLEAAPMPAADDRPALLERSAVMRGELAGGGRRSYVVRVHVGQLTRVVVDQRGIDVSWTLRAPTGEPVAAVEAGGSCGAASLLAGGEVAGDYQLELRAAEADAAAGRYEITLEDARPAAPSDDQRLAAQKACSEGVEQRRENTASSRRRAVARLETGLALWREVGDTAQQMVALFELGAVSAELGENAQAGVFFERALPLVAGLADRRWESVLLKGIGEAAALTGGALKAIDSLRKAQALMGAAGDRRGELETLIDLGFAQDLLGRKDLALEYDEQALALSRAIGDRSNEGTVLNNIGSIRDTLGERQQAIAAYKLALPLRDAAGRAETQNNIGVLYASLGDAGSALDYLERALKAVRALGHRDEEARMLHNVGATHADLKQTAQALEAYGQALALFRQLGDSRGESGVLDRLGLLYHTTGDQLRAFEHLEKALAIRKAHGDRANVAITLHGLAQVHRVLGHAGRALALEDEALALSREVGLREVEASILHERALLQGAAGDLAGARESIEATIILVEELRSRAPTPDLRTSFLAAVHSYYECDVDVLMRLHGERPKEGWNARALEASEQGRGRSLLDLLAEADVDLRQGVDVALLARERSLRQRLGAAAERQLQGLAGQRGDGAAALAREIQTLATESEDVRAEIQQTSPRYAELMQPRPLGVAEIQAELLDDDTMLLEYALGEERSYVWAVTPAAISSHELPPRREIEAAALRLYQQLTERGGGSGSGLAYRGAAANLSRMILAPVADALGTKRLLIVPDGALHYVPFAALPSPVSRTGVAQAPLAVHHELVHAASASALGPLRRQAAGRPVPAKTALVLADPVFDDLDNRVRRQSRTAPPPVAEQQRALNGAGLRGPGGRIARLPYTRQEAATLSNLAPGQVSLALDFQASRDRFLSADVASHRIVHIATHGVLNDEHPELSGLVLSLVDKAGRPLDGFLSLSEIYNLRLPVDLVVLSACQTALGKPVRGEGLVGLTRGFFYAGATRILASLWRVDEVATARLMQLFYDGLLRKGLPPTAALRAAQIGLARETRFQHPYYWAGFVLQGDWR
jgi:CHAT domain-containing protein/tetratricopeptide (TPR) repeat protein